jgi:XTP/dITP diphosphohydrolase
MPKVEIVIASKNLHKMREFRDMLKAFPHIDVLSVLNFPLYELPEETGKSFKDNALIKATHAATTLNKIVLADDSGLIVPSLGGAPGINSRRYAGEDATDAENRYKLLKELEGKNEYERSAYFECCLALSSPSKLIKCVSGTCEGMILTEERGRNGFGYDSLFIKSDGYDKSFAELEEATKNRISHRRKAFEKIATILENLTST